ncbi:hypothetical protein N1496_00160 [Streptococcus didelphis]|uniref:Transporter n=1 Tax=Streptococcus didelphis TaxID=102886 RepID=A0ABY9LH94_9STRE|nr:hypothetical protein [Streptococcus didelphis]WMB28180.1 hypothetical protein N1496_00160 [Streptococcus didelphis]
MRKYLQDLVTEAAYYLEILLSTILTLALIFFSYSLITDLSGFLNQQPDIDAMFQLFLARSMTIAVGVELIKMLSKPSPSTVIEVLLFALTRQLIVEHASMLNFLIGIVAVALLFAIRRYLFIQFDNSTSVIVRGSLKLKMVNIIAHVNIKGDKEESLRTFITRKLNEEDRTISVGSVLYLTNVALRIEKMHGDLITRVEVIRGIY